MNERILSPPWSELQTDSYHGCDSWHLVAVDYGVAGVGEVVEIHEQLHPAEDVVAEFEVQQGVGFVRHGLVYIEPGDSLELGVDAEFRERLPADVQEIRVLRGSGQVGERGVQIAV